MIISSISNKVGEITLNRPEKRNSLNDAMVEQLSSVFEKWKDSQEVKVIILKASGKVFSAGADLDYLQQLQSHSREENLADSKKLASLLSQIYTYPKPVIGMVQGHAIAGGCGLVTVCDFIYAAQGAKFGYTEVKIGFIPAIVMYFLYKRCGGKTTRELLLGGSLISAQQAKDYGIINEVFSAGLLESEVRKFADDLIKGNSRNSMRLIKEMMIKIESYSIDEAMDYASEMNAIVRDSEDCKHGIRSFLEKKPPTWQ